MLIVGRVVAGLGAAGISNGAITIMSSCVPMEKRPGQCNQCRSGVASETGGAD